MQSIESLQKKFGQPGVVDFSPGVGRSARMEIHGDLADAEIYLHGAHVTRFCPRGARPVLFMSSHSRFQRGQPIRGGIPVIVPWFGARDGHPQSPMHGLMRTVPWDLESLDRRRDGSIRVVLQRQSSAAMQRHWPQPFAVRLTAIVAATLDVALEVRNLSDAPMRMEEALHSYFAVGDSRRIGIEGLSATRYIDKADGFARKVQGGGAVTVAGETDRIYLNTPSACRIVDPEWKRSITIEKEGSDSTVVWNPWVAKSAAMPDFGNDEWMGVVCIETSNVADAAVQLPPGATHRLRANVAVGNI